MKKLPVALALVFAIATPCQSQEFSAAKPTPLKLAKPIKPLERVVRFVGTVTLFGRFLATWEEIDKDRQSLRVVFQPDDASAALLPQEKGGKALKELFFSNREQAPSMLLAPEMAQKFLAKETLAVEGEATVTISDYQTGVDCDQRWYSARLVSVSKRQDIIAARPIGRAGC
jgi:hypothetical protein